MISYRKLVRSSKFFKEDFLKAHADQIDWDMFCRHADIQQYSLGFFERFEEKIEWGYFDWDNNPSYEFLLKFKDKITCNGFVDFYYLEDEEDRLLNKEAFDEEKERREGFLSKYSDVFDWDSLSSAFPFSIDEMEEYKDKIKWENIPGNYYLPVEIYIKFKKEIFESSLSDTYILKVIFDTVDVVTVELINAYYEEIMGVQVEKDFKKIWLNISRNLELSKENIEMFFEYLNLESIAEKICSTKKNVAKEEELIEKGIKTTYTSYYAKEKSKRNEGYYIEDEYVENVLIPEIFKRKIDTY